MTWGNRYTPEPRHGSNAQYVRHVKAGETPCQACRDAHRLYQAEWRDRNRWTRRRAG